VIGSLVKWFIPSNGCRIFDGEVNFKFQISNLKLYCLSTIGRTCTFESKIVLDSRFLIPVTRCEKRSKNFLQFSDFRFQLPALLIDF